MIRENHKLLLTYDGRPGRMKYPPTSAEPQLFDLKKDPHEKSNLASEQPELVKELSAMLDAWYPVTERKQGISPAEPAKQRKRKQK